MNTNTHLRVVLAVLALVVSTAMSIPTGAQAAGSSHGELLQPSYQGGGGGP